MSLNYKRNIYVDKKFIETWINKIIEKFEDKPMMYYWLDYTISMQMIQKFAKTYVNKIDNKFIVAIINTELHNKQNKILYGIILLNEKANLRTDGKYPYKLSSLMTKHEIRNKFGIIEIDLPCGSRQHPDFKNNNNNNNSRQLLNIPRGLNDKDIKKIDWSKIGLYRSQSDQNDVSPINLSLSLVVMTNYIKDKCFRPVKPFTF